VGAVLSDRELMLLEQLTYIDNNVFGMIDKQINYSNEISVKDYLQSLIDNIDKLEDKDVYIDGGAASGREYAAVIKALYNNKNISKLKMQIKPGSKKYIDAITFTDGDNSDSAYVAFRGTKDSADWLDNGQGLGQADTALQKEALNYINSLKYKNITTVGHSKGGNKAQYTAILSPKVKRCVSLDGQGFSKEFIEKYEAEIKLNGNKIVSYSLDGDFVNILLNRVPGAKYYYCKPDTLDSMMENHSPLSFFNYVADKDGGWKLLQDNGELNIKDKNQEWTMQCLHEFTCYVSNVMSEEEKVEMGEFIGVLLACSLSGQCELNGEIITNKNLPDYLKAHETCMAKFLAYLMKYCESRPDSDKLFIRLLYTFFADTFIPDDFQTFVERILSMFDKDKKKKKKKGKKKKVKSNKKIEKPKVVHLNKYNAGYYFALKLYDKYKKVKPVGEFGLKVIEEYAKIPDVDVYNARKDKTVAKVGKWDFSSKTYQTIMGKLNEFDRKSANIVSGWNSFYSEDWYVDLSILIAQEYVQRGVDRFSTVNSQCRNRMQRVFEDEWNVDNKKSSDISKLTRKITKISNELRKVADAIE
jgi:hypothetical protein